MFRKLAVAAMLCCLVTSATPAFAQPAPPPDQPAPAQQSAPEPAAAPSGAMTAHFTSFFTQVLAGHVPTSNISSQMRSGFTSQLLAQIDGVFAQLGKFRQLQYLRADTMQQYHRYHYNAVFENGSQGVMFVVDSSGTIVGFFQDQTSNNPQ